MKRIYLIITCLITILFLTECDSSKNSDFTFMENQEGFELSEKGIPLFFYQKKPKSLTGEYICNNYLHPLYNLKGEVLSEEFPSDHPYHRGIFWAWHQLYIYDLNLGDGWIMENIEQDVADVDIKLNKKIARIGLRTLWRSSVWNNGQAFIEEKTSIIVHKKETDLRKIDFEIALNPLVEGVHIGGSDDEKGYGGFCARIKLPDDIVFTSGSGRIVPQNLQISAGPWMDFSAVFGESGEWSGLAILCHRTIPNYPAPWILRQNASMQNIVFPGRERINLDKTVVLRYRLVIHNGDAEVLDMDKLLNEYDNQYKMN